MYAADAVSRARRGCNVCASLAMPMVMVPEPGRGRAGTSRRMSGLAVGAGVASGIGELQAPANNPRRPVVKRSQALLVIPAWFMRLDTPGASPPVSNTVPAGSGSGHSHEYAGLVATACDAVTVGRDARRSFGVWSQQHAMPKPYDHVR